MITDTTGALTIQTSGVNAIAISSSQVVTLTNALLPASGGTGVTALGTGVATALGQNVTGSGSIVLGTSPSVASPTFTGTATAAALTVTGTTTLNTGLTGLAKLTAGVVSAGTAGTDYVAPGTATTFTALQTFAGTSSNAALATDNILEVATVTATAATGTIDFYVTTQSVLYYTSNASANWTVNFTGSPGTTLNTIMATGQSISTTFLVTQGATAYYNSAVQIDGASVTPKWLNGFAPTAGSASAIDVYSYVIIKTGTNAYTVLASVSKFD
jgi:hypothetical protein